MNFIDEINAFTEDTLDFFAEIIEGIIDFVVWIIVEIISFFDDIFKFFKNLVPFGKVSSNVLQDENTKAIVLNLVEKKLISGKFKTVSIGLKENQSNGILLKGLFDKDKKQFVEGTTEINEYEELDDETKNKLGDEDMLVLE